MVLRPYQFYAVEKILDRVENSNDNGYIWHTTGAGKTLTSFKAAQLVSELDDVDKVMFVVDRHDLDTQTQAEYEASWMIIIICMERVSPQKTSVHITMTSTSA